MSGRRLSSHLIYDKSKTILPNAKQKKDANRDAGGAERGAWSRVFVGGPCIRAEQFCEGQRRVAAVIQDRVSKG